METRTWRKNTCSIHDTSEAKDSSARGTENKQPTVNLRLDDSAVHWHLSRISTHLKKIPRGRHRPQKASPKTHVHRLCSRCPWWVTLMAQTWAREEDGAARILAQCGARKRWPPVPNKTYVVTTFSSFLKWPLSSGHATLTKISSIRKDNKAIITVENASLPEKRQSVTVFESRRRQT